jgi:myo-inositol 2-dehydrogenase/D-chiro-inositol 1-dehydrogenase
LIKADLNRRVNIALIGTGGMGSAHARNLARLIPESNLIALCDIHLEVAQAVADELGIARVVRDYHELLVNPV